MLAHQTYDDWGKERSAFERLGEIKVPVYSIGHWGKLGLHLRGNLLGYEEVKSPKKLLVTGARDVYEAHALFDRIEFHEQELLPFYERYLKGVDNGFMDCPPVKIFVRGEEKYRTENEWPLRRAAAGPHAPAALRVIRPDRHGVHRETLRPASVAGGGEGTGGPARIHQRLEGLA